MAADLVDLRAVRSFISGTWNGGGNDQTYAGQDGNVNNPTRQFQTVGANGSVAVEGAPLSNTQTGAVLKNPLILIAGAALLAFVLLRKGA